MTSVAIITILVCVISRTPSRILCNCSLYSYNYPSVRSVSCCPIALAGRMFNDPSKVHDLYIRMFHNNTYAGTCEKRINITRVGLTRRLDNVTVLFNYTTTENIWDAGIIKSSYYRSSCIQYTKTKVIIILCKPLHLSWSTI